jgi:hypothetical protein
VGEDVGLTPKFCYYLGFDANTRLWALLSSKCTVFDGKDEVLEDVSDLVLSDKDALVEHNG